MSDPQATLQYQRGQYAQAVQLFGEVVRLYEQIYPKDKYPHGHPQLANRLNNLGVLLKDQGGFALLFLKTARW